MINQDDRTEIRINSDILNSVKKKVNHNPEIYMNVSHFIRIAIIRELRRKI